MRLAGMDELGVFFQLRVLLPLNPRNALSSYLCCDPRSLVVREYLDMSGPSRQKIMITIQLTQLWRMLADRNEEERAEN